MCSCKKQKPKNKNCQNPGWAHKWPKKKKNLAKQKKQANKWGKGGKKWEGNGRRGERRRSNNRKERGREGASSNQQIREEYTSGEEGDYVEECDQWVKRERLSQGTRGKKIKEILPVRIRDPPVRGQLKWIDCFPFCLRLLQRGSSPQSCSLVSLSEANSNLQLHLTMPDTLLRVSAPITQAFGSLSFPRTMRDWAFIIYWKRCLCSFESSLCARAMWTYDSESNGGRVCGTGRPVRFHHSACKFWPRTAAATEDGEGHRAGGEGWGVCRKWIEWGSEREEEGEWDDRAVGSLFVHASAGKLITRWSSTPLKC